MRTCSDAVIPRKVQRQTFGGYCDAVVGADRSRARLCPTSTDGRR